MKPEKQRIKIAGSAFHVDEARVFQGSRLVVSVWPIREDNEERKNGESWLDMRKRTESDRLDIDMKTKSRAEGICDFLNLLEGTYAKLKQKRNNND